MTRRKIFRAVKDFCIKFVTGLKFIATSIADDVRYVQNNTMNQEDILFYIAKYLLELLAVLLPFGIYLFFGPNINTALFVLYCIAWYIANTVVTRYKIGKKIIKWVRRNPRITIFSSNVLGALATAFIVFDSVEPRPNTTFLMSFYLSCCTTYLTSLGFILFVGIDSKIKQLQKKSTGI